MASAKTGIHVMQLKKVQVPTRLQQGDRFFKLEDELGSANCSSQVVTLKVDSKGFFIQIVSESSENELIDLALVRDTRTGKQAKISKDKVKDTMSSPAKLNNLEDRTFTVVVGSDFANVNFINFVCESKQTAQFWTDNVNKIVHNLLAINSSSYDFLLKSHTRIILMSDKEGLISTKNVIKTFAQHKEDKKRVESALDACGLPSGKNDHFLAEKFTQDTFFTFYKHLVTRKEVLKIYQRIVGNDVGPKKNSYEFKITKFNKHEQSNEDKLMTVDQFVHFLNKEQRDPRLNEILYPYVDRTKGKELIFQFEPDKVNSQKSLLSFDGFLKYLMSEENSIIPPEKLDLNADMDQPLNHYFINSSHNTYLAGHQFTGKSSVEIYRQCLLAGCRCVELDCWNGRNSDEPIVTHGFTMVTDILLKEVLEAIAECAFKTSDYPVILSLENHCSPKQQAKIAMYCRKIFGDLLLTEPLSTHPLKSGVPLPSPNQLLRKIIIKNKKRKRHHHHHNSAGNNSEQKDKKSKKSSQTTTAETPSNSLSSGNGNSPVNTSQPFSQVNSSNTPTDNLPTTASSITTSSISYSSSNRPSLKANSSEESNTQEIESSTIKNSEISADKNMENIVVFNSCDLEEESDTSIDEDGGVTSTSDLKISSSQQQNVISQSNSSTQQPSNQPTKTAHIKESEAAEELSALVNYIEAAPFHSFEYAEKRNRSYEISSFSETQATSLLKERPVDFVNFNKRQLSRIYPRGTRLESSNYNPQLFWNAGCQMVALNYQTLDLGMQLNLGIFEYNGRSGYLLKPDFMRRHDRKFDPFTESIVDGIIAGMVSIQVISGQLLSSGDCKRCGTYVEVDMFGLPADTSRRKRTRIVPNNTLNPVYFSNDNDSLFEFSKVRLPDLASIRLAAYEENGKLIGHRILPVVGLRPGYRHIPLRNENGQQLNNASLFVYIEVKDYVPHQLSALAEALANPIAYQSMIEKRSKQLEALTDDETGLSETKDEEAIENQLADLEIDELGLLQINKLEDLNKENTEENEVQVIEESNTNNSSITKRMKSVGNFFVRNVSSGISQLNQNTISHGLANATSSTINTATNLQQGIIDQNTVINVGANCLDNSLVSGLPTSNNPINNSIQRQETQVAMYSNSSNSANQAEVQISNQLLLLDISNVSSILESQEVINQESENLNKLREHKRVVKVQLEMERELAALRKKHKKQLEKETLNLVQKKDKLLACQTKQKSLLAKTHSKLSRKSISSSSDTKNTETLENINEIKDNKFCSVINIDTSYLQNTNTDINSPTNHENQSIFTTSTLISQFQKKPIKSVSTYNHRRQSFQFIVSNAVSFPRNLLMKRQSEQNLQSNIAENQAKLDDLHRTTAQAILTLLKEQIRIEQETFERYHEKLFTALEKTLVHSQNGQLDKLQCLHDNEVQQLMGRLNCQSKEIIASYASIHKDKNEFARVKRELQQRLIDQAVSERQRFELLLEKRRAELLIKQEQIKNEMNQLKETMLKEKQNELSNRLKMFKTSSEQSDLQQFIDLLFWVIQNSSLVSGSFGMNSDLLNSLTEGSKINSNNSIDEHQTGLSSLIPLMFNHANVISSIKNRNKRRSLINFQHNSSCESSTDARSSNSAMNLNTQNFSIQIDKRNSESSEYFSSVPDLELNKSLIDSSKQQNFMYEIEEERPASALPTTTDNTYLRESRIQKHLHHQSKKKSSNIGLHKKK